MALTFPDSPPIGDLYTAENGVVYEWNGTTWDVEVAGTQYWTGDNDAISYVGDIGVGGSSSFAGSAYFASDVGIGNSNPRGPIHIGADLASGASDAAAINLKQTGVTASTGIYLERSGERRGYYMYLGSASDSLTFQRNDVGAKSDVLRLTRDGDAEFTGNVEVGDFDNTTGTKSFASGSLQVRRNDSNTAIVVYKDGTAAGNQTAVINADGSATFAGDVTIGDNPTDSNNTNNGIRAANYGALLVRGDNVNVFAGYQNGVANPTSSIRSNGNATFNRNVGAYWFESNEPNPAGTGSASFLGKLNGVETSRILADGSAEFDGIIETEGTRGGFISGKVPVASSDALWGVWSGVNFAGTTTSQIKGDGSATFAGAVNIGDWSGSSAGVVSGPSGYVHVRKDGGSNAIGVWNGAGGSPTVSINPDGSGAFAGKLLVGTTGDDGNAKALVRGGVGTNIGVLDIQSNSGSTSINTNSALGYLRFKAGDSGASNHHAAYIGCLLNGPSSGAADVPGALIFGTAPDGTASPVERMMLDSSGGLYHNSSNQGIATFLTQSAGTVKYAFRGHYGSPAGNYGGTISFTVWSNGNVENTNNSYGAISDVTLKENIVPASEQWDNIKDIEVVNYNFKEETGHQTHKQLGVIAQQVEEVSPGLVNTDEEGLKSVNYSVLYMKSVKALQEAMERIEILEQRLSDAGL